VLTDEMMQPHDGIEAWLLQNWACAPETFTVEAAGSTIACRGWNLASRELPGIVLVHGFRAHARWWDHIAPSLAIRHRVVALDLPGMGDSGWRTTYSRAQIGHDILAVAAQCHFDRAIIIGHSFGGICAMLAARICPSSVHRLIIVDSAVPTEDCSDHRIPERTAHVFSDRTAARTRFRLIPPGRWPHPAVLEYVAQHSLKEVADGWTWKFDPSGAGAFNQEVFREALFGISVPVDVIHGDRTEIMTPARLAQLRIMAPDLGQEIAIPACHHHVPIEQPAALVAALNALLANDRAA
jgi:pimeloyl-ACP methyl ester carboxylesterase